MQQQGRPPLVIEQGGSRNSSGGSKGGALSGLGGVLIGVIVSVVLSYFLISYIAVPKSEIDTLKSQVQAQVSSALQPISGYDSRISNIENLNGNNNLTRTINDLEARSAPDLSGYVTVAAYNAKVAELESDIEALAAAKSPSGGGGGSSGDYGELVDSDGDLELWLDRAPSGGADSEYLYTTGGGTPDKATFEFTVVNKDVESRHDFYIKMNFAPTLDTVSDIVAAGACAVGEADITAVTASSEITFSASPSSGCFDENDEFDIKSVKDGVAKGDTESYRVTTYVTQTQAHNVDWEIDYTIRDLD